MDLDIANVLRQAAAAIGEPDRAAAILGAAVEARAGDVAYLSGDDSDESDDDEWEYAVCPDAERRFAEVEFALATRYSSSKRQENAGLDAVAHFAARAAVAFGAVGDRGTAARAFLAKEMQRYRRCLQSGAARLSAAAAARAKPGERQNDPDLEVPTDVAAYLHRCGAGAVVARRATPSLLNDLADVARNGFVVFRGVAFFLDEGDACRGIALRRFRRKLAAALRRGALRPTEAVVGIAADPAVDAAAKLIRWACATRAPKPGARLALRSIGDVDDAVDAGRVAPCMARLHRELRDRHHLKFEARSQYRSLLNALGASVDLAIAIGEERYRPPPDGHQPKDKWADGTRSIYGSNGSCTNYSSTGCKKMIAGKSGSFKHGTVGGAHDCPFVYANVSSLLTGEYGLAAADVAAILAEAGPRCQCLAAFRAVHRADGRDDVEPLERKLDGLKKRGPGHETDVASLEAALAKARAFQSRRPFEDPAAWTDRSLVVTPVM